MDKPANKGVVDYFRSFKENKLRLIRFIACVITFLAPLFPWLVVDINKTSQPELHSYVDNLFGLHGIEALFGILIMAFGLLVLALDMAEYVDAFEQIKNKWFYDPLIEIIISGVLILLAFLATAKVLTSEFELYIVWIGGTVRRTVGCYMMWIGTIGVTVTSVLLLWKKK